MNDRKGKIREYILNDVHVEKEKVQNETLIFKQGFLDSMGLMMLITFLEETFGIKVHDSDMIESNFESINAIDNFLGKKLELKSQGLI